MSSKFIRTITLCFSNAHRYTVNKFYILGTFVELRQATISLSCLYIGQSVRLSVRVKKNSAPIGRILMKFDVLLKSLAKMSVLLSSTRITGTSHEDPCKLMISLNSF